MTVPALVLQGSIGGPAGLETVNLTFTLGTVSTVQQVTPVNGDNAFSVPANARGYILVPQALIQQGQTTPTAVTSTSAGGPGAAEPVACDGPTCRQLAGNLAAYTLYVRFTNLPAAPPLPMLLTCMTF